jgi:hypothetical protein
MYTPLVPRYMTLTPLARETATALKKNTAPAANPIDKITQSLRRTESSDKDRDSPRRAILIAIALNAAAKLQLHNTFKTNCGDLCYDVSPANVPH